MRAQVLGKELQHTRIQADAQTEWKVYRRQKASFSFSSTRMQELAGLDVGTLSRALTSLLRL